MVDECKKIIRFDYKGYDIATYKLYQSETLTVYRDGRFIYRGDINSDIRIQDVEKKVKNILKELIIDRL